MKLLYSFGTDGIREKYPFLNDIIAYFVGKTFAQIIKKSSKISKVVIGYDTRFNSYSIALSIATALISEGIKVEISSSYISTPALAFITKYKNCYGIQITASHNPYYYNGIKILYKGLKISDNLEKQIEQELNQYLEKIHEDFSNYLQIFKNPPSGNSSISLKISDFVQIYTEKLLNHIKNYIINLKDCQVVLDLANGAICKYASNIYKKLGIKVEVLNNQPNGYNINQNCGSTNIENFKYQFQKISSKYPKSIGFSFDGDADRVISIYKHNKNIYILEGDVILLFIAKYLKSFQNINSVALTHMSSLGIQKAFEKENIKVIRTDVGDKYLTKAILENKSQLAAEQSGHIIIPPFLYTGDGILSSLYLIASLQKIDFLYTINSIEKYHQKLINVPVFDKKSFIEKNKEVFNKIEKLYQDVRLYVRPSGTEDVVRILIESREISKIKEIETLINKEVVTNV